MQYNAIPSNTMQYHASLIFAGGAYHCPVGSIMAIFIIIFINIIIIIIFTFIIAINNRLAPEMVEDLVTLKCNLHLLREQPSV